MSIILKYCRSSPPVAGNKPSFNSTDEMIKSTSKTQFEQTVEVAIDEVVKNTVEGTTGLGLFHIAGVAIKNS